MKSKFLMFLLLAIVVVGIIIVTIFTKSDSAADSDRAALILIFENIAADAKSYYTQNGSFENYAVPQFLRKSAGGKLSQKLNGEKLDIIGLGNEIGKNLTTRVKIETIITKNSHRTFVRN